jgi:hypothetical protein
MLLFIEKKFALNSFIILSMSESVYRNEWTNEAGDKNWHPCNFGKSSYSFMFEIISQHLERMATNNNNLAFFSWNFFSFWSHDNCAVPLDFDLVFSKQLREYERLGYLDNTMVIINSDHGQRLISYHENTQEAKEERKNPFLSIRLPKKLMNTSIHQRLLNNRKKLVTQFDIYQTLKQFLYLNKYPNKVTNNDKCRSRFRENSHKIRSKRGISLFENIPMNRSCVDALINSDECRCRIKIESLTDHQFQLETKYSVELINNYLVDILRNKTSEYRKKCALYTFDKLVHHKKRIISNNEIVYEFVIVVQPYDSKFQFDLKIESSKKGDDDNKIRLLNDPKIERLSRYGKTAECIKNDPQLMNFCYCI